MNKLYDIFDWLKENFEKVIFFVPLVLLVFVIRALSVELTDIMKVSVNYFPYTKSSAAKKYNVDFDRVADLIGDVKNPKDLAKYYKRDIFTEYKGAPMDQEGAKDGDKDVKGIKRFRLTKIFRQPVRLLFKGYMEQPDGTFGIQINWGEKTDFKKIGEMIRGYKIIDFKHDEMLDHISSKNAFIRIQKGGEPPLVLEKGSLVTEKELFARFYDKKLFRSVIVYVGYVFEGFKILDITESEVVVSAENGEVSHLRPE